MLHAGSTAATYTHRHTATLLGTAFAPVCCTALCTITLHSTQYPRLHHASLRSTAAHYALHARTQRNPLRRHPTHSATLHDLNHTTLRCAPFMCVHVSTHQPTERVTVRPHTLANFTGHCNVQRVAAPPCAARALAISLHTLRPPQQVCTPNL